MVQQTYSLSNIRFDLAFWKAETCSYFPQSIWLCVQIRLTLFPFYRFLSTDFLSKMFHPIHNTILRSLFCKCNLLLLILSRKFGKIVFCQLRKTTNEKYKKECNQPKNAAQPENVVSCPTFDWNVYGLYWPFQKVICSIRLFDHNIASAVDYVNWLPVEFSCHAHRFQCWTVASKNDYAIFHIGKHNQQCLPNTNVQYEELQLKINHRISHFWRVILVKFINYQRLHKKWALLHKIIWIC